jgi:hypothetical protein
MIGQMRTLLRVKELKEEQAFRAVQRKRAELREAEAAVVTAQADVQASAATLPAREAQAYIAILGKVVSMSAVDDVKAEVVRLQKEHQGLIDILDSRKAVVRRVTDELAAAMAQFRERQKHRDKYVILTDTLAGELAAGVEHREETEIEDLFGTRRKKLS